jgi:predicted DNA-binding transcriptional regulator AlpA
LCMSIHSIPDVCTHVNYLRRVPPVEPADLLDSSEVAVLLGLSRFNAVSTYRRRYADFPEPAIEKGRCILWRRTDIERWAKTRAKAAGRL